MGQECPDPLAQAGPPDRRAIDTLGFINPVLIDADNRILAGHGRVAAAQLLGLHTMPCLRVENMTATQKRAYVIGDNKLALSASWDEQVLAEELEDLIRLDAEFDIEVTEFSIPEVDGLIESLRPEEPGDPDDDELPELLQGPPVSQPGDAWLLDDHVVACGNALEESTYASLLGGEFAQAVITDPSYNVKIAGNVGGNGAIQHGEFLMASGEMTLEEFTIFLQTAFARHSVDGSIHFIFMDFRHMQEMLSAGRAAYTELKNLIVWVKDNGGMGTFYRSRHELVFAYKNGSAPHINNFELGQHGRYRTNVWEYRGVNSFGADRMGQLTLHPTTNRSGCSPTPSRMSRRNGIVLDAFGGSGSTLIAAHKTGRRARIAELDPVYVDRILAPLAGLRARRCGAEGNRRDVRAGGASARSRRQCPRCACRDTTTEMSTRTDLRGEAMSHYDVGYGKPPAHSRWKKGQSWDRIEETEAEIAMLEDMLASDPKNKDLKKELADEHKVREFLAHAVPNYRPRPSRKK